ncbi:MAG TPA: ABC transporter substrate-binding protein, partial [Bifidobacterium sp.]|nr:ABC transporter substrate-binding protein [Bifidobacterium sp.]
YQYLPFEVYARSDFRSTVGKAYKWSSLLRKEQDRLDIIAAGGMVDDTDIGETLKETDSSDRLKLKNGIALWQKDLEEYGANQGFTIR